MTITKYKGFYENKALASAAVGELANLYTVPVGKRAKVILNPITTGNRLSMQYIATSGAITQNSVNSFNSGNMFSMYLANTTTTPFAVAANVTIGNSVIFTGYGSSVSSKTLYGTLALQDVGIPDKYVTVGSHMLAAASSASAYFFDSTNSRRSLQVSNYYKAKGLLESDSTFSVIADASTALFQKIVHINKSHYLEAGESISVNLEVLDGQATFNPVHASYGQDVAFQYDFTVVEEDI